MDGTPRAVTGSREQRESESGAKNGNEQPRRPRTWDQRCKIISQVSDLRRRFKPLRVIRRTLSVVTGRRGFHRRWQAGFKQRTGLVEAFTLY